MRAKGEERAALHIAAAMAVMHRDAHEEAAKMLRPGSALDEHRALALGYAQSAINVRDRLLEG